ncbi:hypothetical protein pb186bvf_002785 [Paramecium bursaria]
MLTDEEQQGLVSGTPQVTQQPQSPFVTIWGYIQTLILLVLIFFLIKFASLNKHPLKEQIQIPITDIIADEPLPKLDDQDNQILQFLLNQDELSTQIDDIFVPQEDFEEFDFEADPWQEGLQRGWKFKNGLRLIVEEFDKGKTTIIFDIAYGYHDDIQKNDNLLAVFEYLKQNQCTDKTSFQLQPFQSQLIIEVDNSELEECLIQFYDSLQSDIHPTSIDPLYEKIGLLLTVVEYKLEDRKPEYGDSGQLQYYFSQITSNYQVQLKIKSPLTEEDIYMVVSESKLTSQKYGQKVQEGFVFDPILYHYIKVNSNETYNLLFYPVSKRQAEFFVHLLQLKTQNSFQLLTNITFTLYPNSEYLILQTESNDYQSTIKYVYSFASYLKRQTEKNIMNVHKDFINFQIINNRLIDDIEFTKKVFNQFLDQIQTGMIYIQLGQFLYQDITITKDDIQTQNIVNQKFGNLEYSANLFDYSSATDLDEQFISNLRMPNLTNYIPTDNGIIKLYTQSQMESTQISLKDPEIFDNLISTEPEIVQTTPIQPIEFHFQLSGHELPKYPLQISQDLWWLFQHDTRRMSMDILIHKLQQSNLVQSKAILKVAQKYIEKQFENSDAIQASFDCIVESNYKGLTFMITGWSKSFYFFFNQIVTSLQQIKDELLFNQIKQELIDDFNQAYTERMQFYALQYLFPKLMLRPVNDPVEIINALQNLDFSTFQEYLNKMATDLRYTAFVQGNINPNDVKQILQKGTPNVYEQSTKTLLLDKKYIYNTKIQLKSPENKLNACVLFLSTGLRNYDNLATLLLYQLYFENHTELQVRFKTIGNIDGLLIYKQSTQEPWKIAQEMEDTLKSIQLTDQLKQQVINNLHNELNHEYYWDKIQNRNFAFSEIELLRDAIQSSEFNVFWQGSLTIQIYGDGNYSEQEYNKAIQNHQANYQVDHFYQSFYTY